MCPELCDAVMQDHEGRRTLAYLERANLFVVPLDTERRWFRYHHPFAELLRHRLVQCEQVAPLLIRASEWYEIQGQAIEAFQQALAAGDIGRAIRLIDGDGMPLYFRGAIAPIIQSLQGLPYSVLDRHPRLWVMLAWSLMISGYPDQMEVKLQGAVAASQRADDPPARDLCGQVSALKAWVAVAKHDVPSIHAETQQAFEKLHPHNQAVPTAAQCAQGLVSRSKGTAALPSWPMSRCLLQVIPPVTSCLSWSRHGMASIELAVNQFHAAAKTYRDILQKLTDPTHSVACEAHLGLARIFYEWNDLDEAESHAPRSSKLAEPMEFDAGLSADAMVARVLEVRNRFAEASTLLANAASAAHRRRFTSRMEAIASLQAQDLLRRGEHAAALELAQRHQLPMALGRQGLGGPGPCRAGAASVGAPARLHGTDWPGR